jgi:hypothetical protein
MKWGFLRRYGHVLVVHLTFKTLTYTINVPQAVISIYVVNAYNSTEFQEERFQPFIIATISIGDLERRSAASTKKVFVVAGKANM